MTPDYRTVTLQVRRGGSWHRLARRTTRLGGGIRWTVGLKPGRHVLRAIYRGRWDLTGAPSRILRVRVALGRNLRCGADRAQSLVDPLVALVDLVHGADRRLPSAHRLASSIDMPARMSGLSIRWP